MIVTYPGIPAMDPETNTVVRNASGKLYDIDDTGFTAPLTFTDLAGVPKTDLRVGPLGVTEQFRVDDRTRVVWKSGPYIIVLWSPEAIEQAAQDAAAAADTARAAAEAAEQAAELMSQGQVGGLVEAAEAAAADAEAARAAAEAAAAPRNDNGDQVGVTPPDPIRFMRGTPAAWAASTYVLPSGFPGASIDPVTFEVVVKVGDGVNTWANLPGITGGEGGGAVTSGDITDSTAIGRALLTSANAGTARTSLALGWLVTGPGSPEGTITAPRGTVYSRTDGGTNTSLYLKESGTGTTGWVAVGGAVTAASLGLTPYANVLPQNLPIQTALQNVPRIFAYTGSAYPSVPADVPAGCAWFDSEGYPSAAAPAAGPRPLALVRDKWFPDVSVA